MKCSACDMEGGVHRGWCPGNVERKNYADPPPFVTAPPALDVQVGGDHYKKYRIQPIEYVHANRLGFAEGTAIKYVTRWRDKGGVQDLRKAIHVLEMLIDLELKAKTEI